MQRYVFFLLYQNITAYFFELHYFYNVSENVADIIEYFCCEKNMICYVTKT